MDSEESRGPWMEEVDEREKLKEEIRHEIVREEKHKKRRKIFTCCFLKLLVVVLIISAAAVAVAKTGLVTVPLFSRFFYKTPAPERTVAVTSEETKNFADEFIQNIKRQVESQVQPGGTDPKTAISLEFTEKDLTEFIRSLELSGNSPFVNAQTSITPEAIEIFGQLKEPKQMFLTIDVKPEVNESHLKITITKIKIGNLPLPVSIGNFLIKKFLESQIKSAEENIAKVGTLDEIALSDGKMTLRGTINLQNFNKEF